MPNTEVRCDKSGCGWTKEIDIDEAKEGMKCQKCGSIVINEEDMRVINKMKKLIKVNKMYETIVPKKFHGRVEVEVETTRKDGTTEETIKITDKAIKITDKGALDSMRKKDPFTGESPEKSSAPKKKSTKKWYLFHKSFQGGTHDEWRLLDHKPTEEDMEDWGEHTGGGHNYGYRVTAKAGEPPREAIVKKIEEVRKHIERINKSRELEDCQEAIAELESFLGPEGSK